MNSNFIVFIVVFLPGVFVEDTDEIRFIPVIPAPLTFNIKMHFGPSASSFDHKTVANILKLNVEQIFARSYMNLLVKVNLISAEIYKTDLSAEYGYLRQFLRSYCELENKEKEHDLYYSVFLYEPSKSQLIINGRYTGGGRAFISTHCLKSQSCAVVRLYRNSLFKSSFILAHELAHSLGVNHSKISNITHVMDASGAYNISDFIWTRESRQSLEDYVRSDSAMCLGNETHRNQVADYFVE